MTIGHDESPEKTRREGLKTQKAAGPLGAAAFVLLSDRGAL
ncbi:hypothetical protein DB32_006440 [Sandaracinus amylolyticus]|uniref:Uncharacterized protein n=1 Tax=Sandaracinus amylolyticus TaxID=927083 RepID=A0A0F6YLK4_9BACT|nr:hypothetical protein DB32_006440 [Sandaracinus amylolyticus]